MSLFSRLYRGVSEMQRQSVLRSLAPFLFLSLMVGQEAKIAGGFFGTWEAKWKDEVICTIRLKPGQPVSGETDACHIRTDENGDLQKPESVENVDAPESLRNVRLSGDILTFEEMSGGEIVKFELGLVGEGKAELTILDVSGSNQTGTVCGKVNLTIGGLRNWSDSLLGSFHCLQSKGLTRFALGLLLTLSMHAQPQPKNAPTEQIKDIQIPRISRPPVLEEFIDGHFRADMKRIDDFRQRQPNDGTPASRYTSAWIGYDDKNLYVMFVCHSPPPAI